MGLCLDLHNEWQFDTIGLPDRVTVIRLVGLCSWETTRLAILHEVVFSATYRRMTLCSGTKLVCVDVAVKVLPAALRAEVQS